MLLTADTDRIEFEAIGTHWAIGAAQPIDDVVRARIRSTIADYDATWSRFRDDSAVARLARDGGPADLGAAAEELLPLLARLRELTDGAMDPFVAASLARLGYGPGPSGEPAPAPTARLSQAGRLVSVSPPALLDVGSAGKGQLVDLVVADLVDAGHSDVVVDASGDLRTIGSPLAVALEHPFDPTAAIGIVHLTDTAIAGSAVNRRVWTDGGGRRLHHVLDARTGLPVDTVAATWAIAPSAMVADALATALFFADPAALEAEFAFEWVRMSTDGRVRTSAALPGELFTGTAA